LVKFAEPRPYADPETAMKKLLEIANSVEPIQDGRIHIEKINGPFLYDHGGKPAEYTAGINLAIVRGLCEIHSSRRGDVCMIARKPLNLRPSTSGDRP
jgi:hypothetical protein